jgi:hypothetical protein
LGVAAGAVDDDADLQLRGGVDDRGHGVLTGEIDRHGAGLDRGGSRDPRRDLLEDVLASGHQPDVEAPLGQGTRERGTDALRRAHDQRPRPVPIAEGNGVLSCHRSPPWCTGAVLDGPPHTEA